MEDMKRLFLLSLFLASLVLCASIHAAPAKIPKLLQEKLDGPLKGIEEIVFALRQPGWDGHWYANFGYYAGNPDRKAYRAMGRLVKYNIRTRKRTMLLRDDEGSVRDPQVHYDGKKIIFSYRKGDSENFNLYEIKTDGTGLKQITDGPFNDIEPTYLPDGGIMFVSNRCNRWVNCWLTQVAVLYRCDGDGGNIEELSSNNEHENTPWPMPDGRMLYTRWEYVDRSQMVFHHLWTTNPDGTGQMVYYGNLHPGTVMIDAKPIPGTDKIVSVFSPGHGRKEHGGDIVIVSPKTGPDDKGSAKYIRKGNFRDPYPVGDGHFLVAEGSSIHLLQENGKSNKLFGLTKTLAEKDVWVHEPRPIVARKRERVLPRLSDRSKETGTLILANVNEGRKMSSVGPGTIKKLLVLETLPMPIHYSGGMEPISIGGTFTLERVLGTVPVEEDGSAYMEVPANRSLFFVAMDENDAAVKRMHSFLSVKPGETQSCVGCHEHRTRTPANMDASVLAALKREPSTIAPIAGIPEVFDYPRDIQPILDEHCVKCHGYERTASGGPRSGGVILTGDRGPMYSHSYINLTWRGQVADGRNREGSNYEPYKIGASASKLFQKIENKHNGVNLTDHEKNMVRYWIESGAAYPGTYAALGGGMIGHYYENKQVDVDWEWPTSKKGREVIERRCDGCHNKGRPLPVLLGDDHRAGPWEKQPPTISRHIAFNLSRPEKSLMLLAPLAKASGGYARCIDKKTGKAIFADKTDPGYKALLAMNHAGKKFIEKQTRFDMPNFKPPDGYVIEMKRYGILNEDVKLNSVMDAYVVDRYYWESLWHKPVK